MLMQRIWTAVALLFIIIGSLYVSNEAFLVIMAIGFGITLGEWLLIAKCSKSVAFVSGTALAALCSAMVCNQIVPDGQWFKLVLGAVSLLWLAVLIVCILKRHVGFGLPRAVNIGCAYAITPIAWLCLAWLIQTGGWALMLSVFMIVWLADVCAYFAGRAFGKRKMAPAISPKKTWAGAVGAVVCVFGAALAARAFLPADVLYTSILFDRIGLVGAFVVVFLLVAVSIAGDLFESALKRQADIKDSSNLLPGHGGFFDRLDAALAVLPVAVATLVWF